jgi:dipeptidyl aminopeptidase/acylaminoacyl peptidase
MHALILPFVVTALQPGAPTKAEPQPEVNWREAEAPLLSHWSQLTFRRDFVKAGEAYFSPNGRRIIFQAVPVPPEGQEPEQHYSMYIADLTRDAEGGPVGISNVRRVSPKGSANTCGWFHPKDENLILFGCTIGPPLAPNKPGFQVGTNKYVWSFPENMKVVTLDLRTLKDGEEPKPTPMFEKPGYCAEASWDPSGRYVLYANVDPAKQTGEKPDADIWVYDSSTKAQIPMVIAPGYDGGPFWSPDGSKICYRSDRAGTDLLQIYVSEVEQAIGKHPSPVGVKREFQLTTNEHVNWGPFWHPSGEFLVYATSEISHRNYEVFALQVGDLVAIPGKASGTIKSSGPTAEPKEVPSIVALARASKRVTFANGADVLPAFRPDGQWMMWTAQRGEMIAGETRPSSQLWMARWNAAAPFKQQPPAVDPTK